ncbi:hypothetical protein TWF694_004604 [Orbilia ellipsospora]|uniref:Uncharacterized protein n=1 Tax=Orbilia ellipsospora TaxID=2528407 RepID=A0AAV9WXV7_9PEZI
MVQTRSQAVQAAIASTIPGPGPISPMKFTTPPPQPPPETPRSQKLIYKEAHTPHGTKSIIAQRLWQNCSLGTPPHPPGGGGKRDRETSSPSEMVASIKKQEPKRNRTAPDLGLSSLLARAVSNDHPRGPPRGVKPMKNLLPAFGETEDPTYDAQMDFETALSSPTTVTHESTPRHPRASSLKKNQQDAKMYEKNKENSSVEANLLAVKLQGDYHTLAAPNGNLDKQLMIVTSNINHSVGRANMGDLATAMAKIEGSNMEIKAQLFQMVLWRFAVKVEEGGSG